MKTKLEKLYLDLNRREYVSPDPLQFLYDYSEPGDREIAGLVASTLAYGRVVQILKSVGIVLGRMGSPRRFLLESSPREIKATFKGFKHRFTTGLEMSDLLIGTKNAIDESGSLGACFANGVKAEDENVVAAIAAFVKKMKSFSGRDLGYLLPSPEAGSACKRINLFLRWMVRRDEVDPGGWNVISPSKLIVPLDTHMHAICRGIGFTARKQADLKTAIEITKAFAKLSPKDPVKYDFALTRLGIRAEMDRDSFLKKLRTKKEDRS